MKLDPGMHIGLHLVSFGKSGVTKNQLNKTIKALRTDRGGEYTSGILNDFSK
jgi:hypothetical protein